MGSCFVAVRFDTKSPYAATSIMSNVNNKFKKPFLTMTYVWIFLCSNFYVYFKIVQLGIFHILVARWCVNKWSFPQQCSPFYEKHFVNSICIALKRSAKRKIFSPLYLFRRYLDNCIPVRLSCCLVCSTTYYITLMCLLLDWFCKLFFVV
jgi:hypothetical protein